MLYQMKYRKREIGARWVNYGKPVIRARAVAVTRAKAKAASAAGYVFIFEAVKETS